MTHTYSSSNQQQHTDKNRFIDVQKERQMEELTERETNKAAGRGKPHPSDCKPNSRQADGEHGDTPAEAEAPLLSTPPPPHPPWDSRPALDEAR